MLVSPRYQVKGPGVYSSEGTDCVLLCWCRFCGSCGDTKIFKTLFALGVGLGLWWILPMVLSCGCQNYKHILSSILSILFMCYCIILLDNNFHSRLLSRKWMTTWELIVKIWSLCQDPPCTRTIIKPYFWKSPRMTSTSKLIVVKYHWFRHNIGKEFVINKIKSENQKTDIFTKGL